MASQIIAALRRSKHRLRGNTFLIATELAHRLNGQGTGRVSYRFLAWKAHCSLRTAIRQIAKLCELGLIRKVVTRTSAGCDWNQYYYLPPLPHFASPPGKTRYAKVRETLPSQEREKKLGVLEELANHRKVLRLGYYTEGSERWTQTQEDIARLEGLLTPPDDRTC